MARFQIPTELGRWTNLVAFDLYDTKLSGPIPSEFGQLKSLWHYLVLSNNELDGAVSIGPVSAFSASN
jgi:hypothetical protein